MVFIAEELFLDVSPHKFSYNTYTKSLELIFADKRYIYQPLFCATRIANTHTHTQIHVKYGGFKQMCTVRLVHSRYYTLYHIESKVVNICLIVILFFSYSV